MCEQNILFIDTHVLHHNPIHQSFLHTQETQLKICCLSDTALKFSHTHLLTGIVSVSKFKHRGFVCRLCAYTLLYGGEAVVKFVCAANFPPLYEDERGATSRKGRRRRWGGGHSIGTPRHSEGNHPKYFPLCVASAPGLLLLLHTHVQFEKVLKLNTHILRKCSSHITRLTPTFTLSGLHTWRCVRLRQLMGSLCSSVGRRAVCHPVCPSGSQIRKGRRDCSDTPVCEFMNE